MRSNEAIKQGTAKKGDVLGVAACGRNYGGEGEPLNSFRLCHVLMLTKCTVDLFFMMNHGRGGRLHREDQR